MVNKSLEQVIKQIGMSSKHALVYETLLSKPGTTPLVLARETKLNRSSLYRYLEELREKGLVELVLGDRSTKYVANPAGLEQYLVGEEARVEKLRTIIPPLVNELVAKDTTMPGNEVKYYQGVEGLRQMLWNVVQAKGEFLGLGYEDWNTSVGKTYADKLRRKMLEDGVLSREILNKPDDSFSYTALGKTYTQVYEHRTIDPKILEIRHDTYIYGDVFAYYYHSQGELFGVEIHNAEIAKTEKQMFEILWKIAK